MTPMINIASRAVKGLCASLLASCALIVPPAAPPPVPAPPDPMLAARVDAAFGQAPMPGQWGRVQQPLQVRTPLLPGDYQIKAQVAPRLTNVPSSVASVKLLAHSQAGGAATPGARRLKLAAPPGTELKAYDELWIDHRASEICQIQLDMDMRGADQRVEKLRGSARITPVELMVHRPGPGEWVKKDFQYLLQRQFGLKQDDRWRYSSDGDRTVLQRRFHTPVNDATMLELELPTGSILSGVNLFLSIGEHGRPNRLLSGDELPSETHDDGLRTRVRVRLDRALQTYRNSLETAYLAEVLVFYQGLPAEVAGRKPIHKLTLLGTGRLDEEDEEEAIGRPVPVKVERATASSWRLAADLRDLQAHPGPASLASVTVTVKDQDDCWFDFEEASLVKLADTGRPEHESEVAGLLRGLGGPFLMRPAGGQGQVEWLESIAQLPVAQARLSPRRLGGSGYQAELPGWGVKFTSGNPGFLLARTDNGLQAQSAGEAVDLDWAVEFRVQDGQMLHVGVPKGGAGLDEVELEIALADGGRITGLKVPVNRSFNLSRWLPRQAKVTGLSLRFGSAGEPHMWTLGDVTVFRPYLLTRREAFDAPRPGWGEIKLPVDLAPPGTQGWRVVESRLSGVLGPVADGLSEMKWRTPIGLPARDLGRVRLNFQFDQEAQSEVCWLRMAVIGESGGRYERQWCPQGDAVSEDLARAMTEHFVDGENVVSIEWTVEFQPIRPVRALFETTLGVFRQPSAWATFQRGLRLAWAGVDRLPDLSAEAAQKATIDDLVGGIRPVWLDYGVFHVEPGQTLPAAMRLRDHELFGLKHIVLFDPGADAQEVADWRRSLRASAGSSGLGKLTKLALTATLAAGAWLAWHLRWIQTCGHCLAAGARASRSLSIFLVGKLGRLLVRRAPQGRFFNFSAALFSMLMLWLGGQEMSGALWFKAGGVFLIMAAGWHQWRWSIPSASAQQQLARRVLLLAWMGWVAWALGAGTPYRDELVAVALGPLWCYSVSLRGGAVKLLRSAWLAPVALLAAALVCYVTGLTNPVQSGESAWFTAGALLLVLAWWRAARNLRSRVASQWPSVAERAYGSPGAAVISGGLLMLAVSAFFLTLGASQVAAHFATLFFYHLCLGAGLNALAYRRRVP